MENTCYDMEVSLTVCSWTHLEKVETCLFEARYYISMEEWKSSDYYIVSKYVYVWHYLVYMGNVLTVYEMF